MRDSNFIKRTKSISHILGGLSPIPSGGGIPEGKEGEQHSQRDGNSISRLGTPQPPSGCCMSARITPKQSGTGSPREKSLIFRVGLASVSLGEKIPQELLWKTRRDVRRHTIVFIPRFRVSNGSFLFDAFICGRRLALQAAEPAAARFCLARRLLVTFSLLFAAGSSSAGFVRNGATRSDGIASRKECGSPCRKYRLHTNVAEGGAATFLGV